MSYRVFARKYRPQRFQDVVGQRSIIQTLQNAITSQKLAQAYLFVGPRGVGKTSIARIFAKALNCYQGITMDPCGHCAACLEIAEGHSMDVLEIDGASNNSVESIRTLRDNAAFAPVRGPYKIYLIDEVHMLTTAAFNALLKTLEEPPEHVKFIFATTEAQKLPSTITSRCQRFDLIRLTEKEIANHLLLIAQKEEIVLSAEAALGVAHGADGAMRDAESMLDQLVAFCGKTISEQDVQHIFGFTPSDLIHQLGKAILSLDIHAALTLIQDQSDGGKDLSRLLNDLIYFFRDLLVETVHPSREQTCFSVLRDHVSSEKLLSLLEELGKAEERFRWATNKKLQLDVLAIKAIHLLQEVSLTDVLDVLTTLREGKSPPEKFRKPVATLVRTELENSDENQKSSPLSPSPELLEKVAPSSNHPQPIALSSKEDTNLSLSSSAVLPVTPLEEVLIPSDEETCEVDTATTPFLNDPWSDIATSLGSESPLKFGWLTTGRFVERKNHQMFIEFPSSYEAQTETLFWSQARKKIQERLTQNLGEKIELVTLFTGEEVLEEALDEEIMEVMAPQEAPKKASPQPAKKIKHPQVQDLNATPTLTPQELEHFKNDPLIQKALELFEAEIVQS
ncbi:MAG: DNA polymerase III subunit gamma/tau [Chthoniobacterales bacterium]|nr:DNA polymerase III subunit gamma/tau [Chthoniobacterales bacterium]